jgi:hypothetical protein
VLQARRAPAAERPDAGLVVVKADAPDTALANEIVTALAALNYDVVLAPDVSQQDGPRKTREEHERLLTLCDAFLLVYGHTQQSWVQAEFAVARKLVAGQRARFKTALLDGPPSDKAQVGLQSPSLIRLDCRTGFAATALAPLVTALRASDMNA